MSENTVPSPAYPRLVLAVTMGASTWLNVLHAAGGHPVGTPYRTEMMVAASIPPLLVPVLIELLGREARRGATSARLFRSAYWVVVLLTIAAFSMSVWSIASLGVTWGMPLAVAIGFPVVLDLAAGASTIFLLDRALGEQRVASTVRADQDHTDEDTAVDQSADQLVYPMLDPARWDRGPLADLDMTVDLDRVMVQNAEDREVQDRADGQVRTDQNHSDEEVHVKVDQYVHTPLDQQVQMVADLPEDQDADRAVQPAEDQADQDAAPVPEVQRTTGAVVRAVPEPVDRAPVRTTDSDLDRARAILSESSMSYTAEQVAAVLALLSTSTPSRAIAEQAGISKSGVLRIKSAARELVTAA